MIEQIDNSTPLGIEKNDDFSARKHLNSAENSHNFRKLIAEIIVEIIVKKQKNGCDRIHKNK
ncbi:hypothetical protein [Mucilaginibacter sp.]|jgi:hypothetical protein|uniref:hypothetical protein n=1 Tax=Mucilaginibacter sp. TaxID=1882438 RepID=UPI003565D56A